VKASTPVGDLCRSYLDLKWHFNPSDGSLAGAVAFDPRLGTFDAESMRAHLAAFRSIAGAVEEADVDDLAAEIDRTALLDDIRTLLFRFEHERPHVRNPSFWLTHLFEGVYALLARPGDPAPRAPAALERLRAAPAFLDSARATLAEPPAIFVDAALAALGGGGELIVQASSVFSGAAPDLAEQLQEAAREALEALAGYGRALGAEILPSDDPHAFAVGEDQFSRRLHHEHALRGGAPDLWRYGMHLLEETEAAVAFSARAVDPTRHWREVVERLREDTVEGDIPAAYAAEVERARSYIERCGLATLPAVPLDVVPTPSFLASLVPFAAYSRPPVEIGGPGLFYVTVPNAAPVSPRRPAGHCVHEIASLVAHEAFPGHHLQMGTAQALPSEVRRHIWTPVMVEGWALYAESLMAEEGFFETPEARLFHLVNLLWRARRIVVDIGLHTRGLKPSDAVDQLLESMPMERRSAEAEVRRYCAMPTYQLAYAVGRREILSLRDAYQARHGGAFSPRDFHTELLSYGGLPVSLARWGMGLDE
jgi:hypothetical protein